MGLCGSSTCGCGVSASTSTASAIGGYVPTIDISGSGVSGDPYDLTLDTDWADAVADHINGVQYGVTSVSLDGSGDGAITFPSAFTAAPTFTATVEGDTPGAVWLSSITTTTANIQVFRAAAVSTSTSRTVHWVAIGTLA